MVSEELAIKLSWHCWPKGGLEMLEHEEQNLEGLWYVVHRQTRTVLKDRLERQKAFELTQFGFEVILETMDAYAENLRVLNQKVSEGRVTTDPEFKPQMQEDSEPDQPGEAGR